MDATPQTTTTAATPPPGDPPNTTLTTPPPTKDAGTGAAPSGQPPTGTPASAPQDPQPKGTEGAPAEIELAFPKDFQANAELVASFKGIAKELGLKSEGAQKLADVYVKAQGAALATAQAGWEQQQKSWVEALKTDKEIGGSGFDANTLLAQKAMHRFATPELLQYLNQSGAGNNPELVRLMVRVGKALSEDSVSGAGARSGGNPPSEEALIRAVFPTHFKE